MVSSSPILKTACNLTQFNILYQMLQISFTTKVWDCQIEKASDLQLACFKKPHERPFF